MVTYFYLVMETADQRGGLQSYPPPSALLLFNRRTTAPLSRLSQPHRQGHVTSFQAEAGLSMALGSMMHEPVLGGTPLWPEELHAHALWLSACRA